MALDGGGMVVAGALRAMCCGGCRATGVSAMGGRVAGVGAAAIGSGSAEWDRPCAA